MKQPLKRIIKLLLTLVVLALLFTQIDLKTLLAVIAKVKLEWMFCALLLSVLMVTVRWFNWHLLVNAGLGQTNYKETFASLLGSMSFALVTPARVGDLSRIAFLKSGRRAEASGLVLVDRFIDLSVVLILGTIGMLIFFGTKTLPLLLLANIFLFVGIFKLDFFLKLGARLLPHKKIQDITKDAALGLGRLTLRALAINLSLTVLLNLLDIMSLYVLVRALDVDNFKAVVFVYPLVMLSTLLPITVSGIGVREGASVALFALFSIAKEVAFNATFLAYLINSLAPALVGLYFFRQLNREN